MPDMMQMIVEALRGGAGGAGGRALEQQGSGYREYAINATANGEPVMPPEAWAAQQAQGGVPQGGMPPPQQPPMPMQ